MRLFIALVNQSNPRLVRTTPIELAGNGGKGAQIPVPVSPNARSLVKDQESCPPFLYLHEMRSRPRKNTRKDALQANPFLYI